MTDRPRFNLLKLSGYRSLRDVSLQLGDLTVLIGANGAGKSNLLDALRLLKAIRRGGMATFVGVAGGASTLLHRGLATCDAVTLELTYTSADSSEFLATDRVYACSLLPTKTDGFLLDDTLTLEFTDQPQVVALPVTSGGRESVMSSGGMLGSSDLGFGSVAVFHFHDTAHQGPLRSPANASDDQALRDDGGNLAACLFRLKHSKQSADRVAWEAIQRKVREVAPAVHVLRPTETSAANPMVRLDWEDVHGNVFGCHQLSDGTLRAIALLTATHLPTLPALMAFDEPELGLHPAALATIAGAMRSASARAQILIATQSPALLDEVPPEAVVVCESKDGATDLRRLDVAELERWLAEYSLSDLWHMNVLGGRP